MIIESQAWHRRTQYFIVAKRCPPRIVTCIFGLGSIYTIKFLNQPMAPFMPKETLNCPFYETIRPARKGANDQTDNLNNIIVRDFFFLAKQWSFHNKLFSFCIKMRKIRFSHYLTVSVSLFQLCYWLRHASLCPVIGPKKCQFTVS